MKSRITCEECAITTAYFFNYLTIPGASSPTDDK
jgi:hypothetical protein